ncbi:myosin-13-like isoform X2 [Asterias rubens]|uniref:myosin-13-like isoform X2 n=1 Tax=Asterias rubens TaxID=7604 RepID=UPI001454E87F|nr:myosin-13-like isoform X2 [Asterias rubens]
MFATPGRHQLVDKENVGAETKTPGKSLNPVTPARKPLSCLNQDLTTTKLHHGISLPGNSIQKIWTPMEACTPRGSKSSNKKKQSEKNRRKSRGPSLGTSSSSSGSKLRIQSVTEAAESLLNEVLLNEITNVSHSTHKMYNVPESSIPTDGDNQLAYAAANLVESTLEAAMIELIDEEQAAVTILPVCKNMIESDSSSIIATPSTEQLWSIALGFEDSSDDIPHRATCVFDTPIRDSTEILNIDSTPMGVSDFSLYTPTMASQECLGSGIVERNTEVTPARSMDSGTTPIKSAEIGLGIDQTLVADSCMGTTPVKSNDANFGTTPVKSIDANFGTTPVKSSEIGLCTDPAQTIDSCIGTTPVKSNDANFGTTPVKSSEIGLGTHPAQTIDSCIGTTPVKSNDANFGTTPVKSSEIGLGTDPAQTIDSCIGTTPVKSIDANFGTTPVKSSEIGLGTDPAQTIDSCIGTTPVKSIDANFGTTPVKSSEIGLCTDPAQTIDSCIGTTPVKLAKIGLATDPTPITDSCIGTTPIKIAEMSVGTSPLVTADVQCGMSPVYLTDTQCGSTPYCMKEVGTAITPVTLNVAGTLTSPIVVPAFRLDAESPSQLDQASLLSHMESASISNELLRCELHNLKANQADLHSQLDVAKRLLEQKEEVSSRKDRDEGLLSQIGEQMNQIGFLQETLDQKSSELTAAHQDKANLKDQYRREILNLQQDLRSAYKQHQQEISELRSLHEQSNYEPHYKRALATVTELQIEVQAYRDLKDTLDKAAEVQAQFGCIEEAYSLLNALFTRTMEKKDQLEMQHSEMVNQMKETNDENKELKLQLATAKEQEQQLQTELEDTIKAEKDALEVQGLLMKDLDTNSHAMAGVNGELHATKLELFVFKDDFTSLKVRYDNLQKQSVSHFLDKTSMEAALAVQGKQWQDTMTSMKESHSKYETEIHNLTLENTRLSAEVSVLTHELSSSKNQISAMESENEISEEMLQRVMKEVESLKTELESTREAKAGAKRLAGQIQTLRKQFKENIEFLEEERGALVESAHETEVQLKIETLELSRLKVALYNAEETNSKWKSAAENLSEKLQVYQSELDNTKAHAHWMIINQVTEMREAGEELASLVSRMQNIYSYLNINAGHQEVTVDQTKDTHQTSMPKATKTNTNTTNEPRPSQKSGSLVASILCAVQSKDSQSEALNAVQSKDSQSEATSSPDKHLNEDIQRSRTPSPLDRRLTIGGSTSSAFSTVQTSANQDAASIDVSPPVEGRQSSDDNVLLGVQVDKVKEQFGKLLQLLMTRIEDLESSAQHLEHEKTELNSELLKAKKQHDHEVCLICEQLRESEMQERRLRQEVSNGKTSLSEFQQALQYSQQRLQEMADNLGRFSDQKSIIEKLQSESVKLNGTLRLAHREKALLQEQLDSILTGSSQSSSEGAECRKVLPQETVPNSKLIKENIGLKKDMEKIRLRLIERRDHYEALNTRATRHVRVLEENWHKADAEVYRLDELFDQCKQLMEQVPTSSNENPHLVTLRALFT